MTSFHLARLVHFIDALVLAYNENSTQGFRRRSGAEWSWDGYTLIPMHAVGSVAYSKLVTGHLFSQGGGPVLHRRPAPVRSSPVMTVPVVGAGKAFIDPGSELVRCRVSHSLKISKHTMPDAWGSTATGDGDGRSDSEATIRWAGSADIEEEEVSTERTPLLKTTSNTTAPTPTPLPAAQLFIVLLLRVTEPISYTVCFPFINQMLLDIGVVSDPKKAGFYAGIVSSHGL